MLDVRIQLCALIEVLSNTSWAQTPCSGPRNPVISADASTASAQHKETSSRPASRESRLGGSVSVRWADRSRLRFADRAGLTAVKSHSLTGMTGGYRHGVPEAIFAHSRLAPIYDAFDGPREDLAAYLSMAAELRAGRVLDVGRPFRRSSISAALCGFFRCAGRPRLWSARPVPSGQSAPVPALGPGCVHRPCQPVSQSDPSRPGRQAQAPARTEPGTAPQVPDRR